MKNENGINIISLILTVVIILILATTLIVNSRKSPEIQKYNRMSSDIQILEDKISVYYNKYGQIPIKETEINENLIPDIIKEKENNEGKYYEIDIENIKNISLSLGNYHFDNSQDSSDKYIINNKTHKVYYFKGIQLDEKIYYAKDLRQNI